MSNHNEVCLICKSSNVLTDLESGEIVCSNCGTVISDKIQENKELRTFNIEEAKDRRRTGMPTSLAEMNVKQLERLAVFLLVQTTMTSKSVGGQFQ